MFRKLTLAILIVLLLAACGQAAPAATPTAVDTTIRLTDGLGRDVSLASPALRVVSLAPSNTEILYAVGAGDQVVGRDMFSDYPAAAQNVQDIGGSMGEYDLEAIAALGPDLVLAGGINPPELVASLEALGLTVYFLPNPTTLEEMYANLETVATLTGHSAETAGLVESLQARVAAVDAKIATASARPTVFYEYDAYDPTKPYTYGPGSFGDLLIQRAGGANVGAGLDGPWAQISLEQLVAADPSIVILGDSAYGVTAESFAARAGLDGLDAVRNNRIFPFDDNLVSRPGPRLVDGLEALAKLLHPELFE